MMEHGATSPNHGPFGQSMVVPVKQSLLAGAGREETLPRLVKSNGSSAAPVSDGKLKGSWVPSPQQTSLGRERSASPGSEDEEEDPAPERPEAISPLKSGVDDHRADPALRVALESLDAVRQRQPDMGGFAIENYLGHIPVPTPVDGETSSAVPLERFSLDALLAAAQAPLSGGQWSLDASGSTSFGSTQGSFLSSGTNTSSGTSSAGGTGRNRIGPRRPPVAPVSQQPEEALAETPCEGASPSSVPRPRRPGRHRARSARSRRSRAASEDPSVSAFECDFPQYSAR